MKKLLALTLAAALVAPAFAEEKTTAETTAKTEATQRPESGVWPSFFAFGQFPRSASVIGIRLTIPYSTAQEGVTGLDIGFWGKTLYAEGFQINVLRNDAKDTLGGFQIGIYNSAGRAEAFGLQVGLWNEAMSIRGMQVGLVNCVGSAEGFQVGVINLAETMGGYQVGLVNVIRDAELQFFPVINIGF